MGFNLTAAQKAELLASKARADARKAARASTAPVVSTPAVSTPAVSTAPYNPFVTAQTTTPPVVPEAKATALQTLTDARRAAGPPKAPVIPAGKAAALQEATAKRGINFKKGGSVGSASKRADGCAQRGKTKGRML